MTIFNTGQTPSNRSGVDHLGMDATSTMGVTNDPRLELTKLDFEIGRIQAVLEQLLERRIAVKRQINSQYSPILQLPAEILSNIFMACYPVNDRKQWASETQFLLGSICSTWRAAAWSTSQVWSTISLTIHEGLYSRDKFTLFRDWLARAYEQPLSLIFKYMPIRPGYTDTDSFYSLVDQEVIQDTLDLIAQCYERWENVDLRVHQSLQAAGYSFEGGFPQLKSIRLTGDAYQPHDLKDFHSASQLREVRLSRFDDPATAALNLPQNPNMRLILDLGAVHVHDCLDILLHRPNFIHLQVEHLLFPRLNATFTPVTAPLLQSLEVAHPTLGYRYPECCTGVIKFLENLTAPSLHSLSIVARDDSWAETCELVEFVSRSGCSLKKLSITCDTIDGILVRCLSLTPALTTLDLCVDDIATKDWISLAVDLGSSNILVPKLAHFTYTHSTGVDLDCSVLATMLASRRQPITPGSKNFTRLVDFKIVYAESDLDPFILDDNILEDSMDLRSEWAY